MTFEFDVLVRSDDGRPVRAEIVAGAGSVTTNAEGRATLVAHGHDGDRVPHVVKCSKEYHSPATPLLVSLRRDAGATKRPVHEVTCVPIKRTVVVGVRLDNGPNLPVVYLGRQVARTDPSGAAHVRVEVAPGEPFQLKIDTSERGNEDLRPQNPAAEFSVDQNDDLLVFDQKMSVIPKPVLRKPVFVRPKGPTKL